MVDCPVCDDLRRVRVVRLIDPAISGRGVVTCPRCAPEPGRRSVRIADYPPYVDEPRTAA